MNKIIQFLLILALLVGVVAVAASQTVWASPAPVAPAAAAEKVNPVLAAKETCVGTVCTFIGGDNCEAKVLIDVDYEPVCGVAFVTTSAQGDVVRAYKKGDGVTLEFQAGSAQICFAAPKNGVNKFRPANDDNTWVEMPTVVSNGLACTTATQNGFYKFEQFHN